MANENKRVRSKWGSMFIKEVLHREEPELSTIGSALISGDSPDKV
jgi:hypothetical protein